jgi:hypothetical protein
VFSGGGQKGAFLLWLGIRAVEEGGQGAQVGVWGLVT